MPSKNSLTAVVLTKNNVNTLKDCLSSVKFAQEIIIVDDGSTDGTLEIARKFHAKIYSRRLDNFSSQRNFALKKVTTPWVLFLDDDETVSPGLAREIKAAIEKENSPDGFYLPRKNYIFGRWVRHSGWYPDYQLHLFKTAKGRYQGQVHEQVEIDGQTENLKNHLHHQNFQNLSHFLSDQKFNLYADLAARQLLEEGYQFSPQDLISKPVNEFLRRFFAEKGYLDGYLGFILSFLQSFKEFVIYAKVWEKTTPPKNRRQSIDSRFLPRLLKEQKKKIVYWLLSVKIARTKNPFQKLLLKIKKKLLS